MKLEIEDLIKLLSQDREHQSIELNKGFLIFYQYLKNYRRKDTQEYHLKIFKSFKSFCDMKSINQTFQITNDLILQYMNYLKLNGNKNITVNKRITSIKYMLNYLYKNGYIEKPKLNIEKLENDSARIDIINQQDLEILIKHKQDMNLNQRLSILLMLRTGIRRNELVNIKLTDIDYMSKTIYLTYTKTNNPRYIFIDDELIELIKIKSKGNLIYLFESETHEPLNHDIINNYTKQVSQKLGIKITPHMLRHTFATKLFDNNIDLESIRLLLGHSDYTMLKRYIHVKNKRLAEISTSLKF